MAKKEKKNNKFLHLHIQTSLMPDDQRDRLYLFQFHSIYSITNAASPANPWDYRIQTPLERKCISKMNANIL